MVNRVKLEQIILDILVSFLDNRNGIPTTLFEKMVKLSEELALLLSDSKPELILDIVEIVTFKKEVIRTEHLKELYKDKDFTEIVKDIFKGENK